MQSAGVGDKSKASQGEKSKAQQRAERRVIQVRFLMCYSPAVRLGRGYLLTGSSESCQRRR